MVTVNTDAICAAIKDVVRDTRSILGRRVPAVAPEGDVQRRGLQGRIWLAWPAAPT